jgi:hypothetical protein
VAGAGLNGGTITSSGTVSLATSISQNETFSGEIFFLGTAVTPTGAGLSIGIDSAGNNAVLRGHGANYDFRFLNQSGAVAAEVSANSTSFAVASLGILGTTNGTITIEAAAATAGSGIFQLPSISATTTLAATGVPNTFSVPQILPHYTVATLPSGTTIGQIAVVTDALTPSLGVALTGGGTFTCLAIYNGTSWVAG